MESSLGISRCRHENNVEIYLKGMGWKGVNTALNIKVP
jgi:hypothetical protein